MREVNFSIPSVNKASVNITTTLYDRRALDCTSTLPLINSLNHLAYLTTSSARIRDILTVDGGIERLVCILKEGRSHDLMEMWKWSLAFQCVVNIGVRGSENVRTRVVEADMVPVIATILDNYIKVFDKARARMDAEAQKHSSRHHPKSISANAAAADASSSNTINDTNNADQRSTSPSFRRQAPPPNIEIPRPLVQEADPVADPMDITSSPPRMPLTSPPERSAFGQETHNHHNHRHHRHHHHHHHHHHHPNEGRSQGATHRHRAMQPLATTVPTMDTADGFNLRPVRDTERLPSMLPRLHTGFTSQPDSPTTPNGVLQTRSDVPRTSTSPAATIRQRPALHQHASASGESDDGNGEGSAAGDDTAAAEASEPIVGLQNQMEIDGVDDRQTMLDDVSNAHDLTVTDPSEGQDAETFNITHRSAVDGSLINNNDTTQTNGTLGLSPARTANNTNSPVLVPSPYAFYYRDRTTTAAQGVLTAMPRDEDVLMSLQLLAYVSKYCNLRSFFQHSHLVPKLKIDRELSMLDDPNSSSSSSNSNSASPVDSSEEDEYLLPDDVNIFPLVEKFTVRHHSKDMRYWACVVMRNLCRKDESRGGIRQCAYYKCGKWEEFQRQFAKCRRCRRTKYCSKDCQKAAWVYHRHWCHTTP